MKPEDGPSAKAGLKANDIITAINGQAIKDGDDLLAHVADAPVGSTLTLSVDRDGKKMDFKVVTQDRKLLFADNRTSWARTSAATTSPSRSRRRPA